MSKIDGEKRDPALDVNWINAIDVLVYEQEAKGYKKSWCYYKMTESIIPPPLEAWEYLAQELGYRHGWAQCQYDRWWERKMELGCLSLLVTVDDYGFVVQGER